MIIMYNNITNNQSTLKYTSSSMVQVVHHLDNNNNNNNNNKNVPELTRHSESPESFEMPKTPSIHTLDDTALSSSLRPILKQQG